MSELVKYPSSPITSKKMKTVFKNLTQSKSPGLYRFTDDFYKIFKECLLAIFFNHFQNIEEMICLSNSFYKINIILLPKADRYY